MNLSRVELAIRMATEAHHGQFDRSKQPYILHPLRVGAAGQTEDEQIVGFLHDTIEDTTLQGADILKAFGTPILDAVLSVTKCWKWNGYRHFQKPLVGCNEPAVLESYVEFIERAGKHPVGRRVKLFDLYDNTRDSRMVLLPKVVQARLIPKYTAAIKYLEGLK